MHSHGHVKLIDFGYEPARVEMRWVRGVVEVIHTQLIIERVSTWTA